MRSIFRAVIAALLAFGVLAACGTNEHDAAPPSAHSDADHNADDIAFAQSMISHHQQAIEMAQMVPLHTKNPKMVDFANRVPVTMTPEIEALRASLMAWSDVPAKEAGPAMTGLVNQATMARLRSSTGPDFDRLWLTSMIAHLRAAIAAAQTEVAHGKNGDVIYLAKSIIANEQAGIDRMNEMLGG